MRCASHEAARCRVLFVLLPAIALAFCVSPMHAQPVLNLKRLGLNWPTVELYIAVACNGQPAYSMGPQNFEIHENGDSIGNFTLTCPEPGARCAMSVGLVFDCSGSMAGAVPSMIQAGLQFVSNMDGQLDEACVIRFGSTPKVDQTMTVSKTLLNTAIAGLSVGGISACWDGCYEGVTEVIRAGTNTCRAVILVADDADNGSTHSLAQIITLATEHHVRVFTIGVGTVSGTELSQLARSTGGIHYSAPSPADLMQIYADISAVIKNGFQECLITYQTRCPNGATRTVDLLLKDFCGGSDHRTTTYVAPKDTSNDLQVTLQLGTARISGGDDVIIPLILTTPVTGALLTPATFTVRIADTACGTIFRSIETPAGSLLDSNVVTATPSGNTITFQATPKREITGSGLLANLVFSTRLRQDTCCTPVLFESWISQLGCIRPALQSGQICVIPRWPDIGCGIDAVDSLRWNRTTGGYTPNPFSVRMIVTNHGKADATNARFRIDVDTAVFALAGPMTPTQPAVPPTVAQGSGTSEAAWNLAARTRMSPTTSDVRIIASFDNHPDVVCTAPIHIPAADLPRLQLNCTSTPTLSWDEDQQKYLPSPFTAELSVRNYGTEDAENVTVGITLPPGVVLNDPADSLVKHPNPPTIRPVQSGDLGRTLSWQLRYEAFPHVQDTLVLHYTARSSAHAIEAPPVDAWCLVLLPPKQPLVIHGSTALCAGDSVVLDAGAGYLVYQWTNGATSQSITVGAPGVYMCTMLDAQGRRFFTRSVEITLRTLTPAITITGRTTLCVGETVALTAEPGFTSYAWSSGERTRSITVSATGSYTCAVADAVGCSGTSQPVTVTVLPVPTPTLTALPAATFCLGDSAVLDAGPGFASYRWSTGATGRNITVHTTGLYTCDVTDTAGCQGSGSLQVTAEAPPVPIISLSSQPPFCEGDTIVLDAGAGYRRHQWSGGEQTRTIQVTGTGTFHVQVETQAGCIGTSRDTTLTFLPRPAIPVVQRADTTLSTPAASPSYRWERNGVPIPGATQPTLPITLNGAYTVTVASAEGCETTSAPFGVSDLVGVEALPGVSGLDVWPEPTSGVLNIAITTARPQQVRLVLHDMLGHEVASSGPEIIAGHATRQLDMRHLAAGIYRLTIHTPDGVTGRLVTRR